ncbi:MAG TPA: hypothetical protein VGH89_31530 [Pseudonocardia sp.]
MSSIARVWVWLPGLVVTLAAAAATAHGLFEVALGCGTPRGVAWLYPVTTDGLALVAYAATNRLSGSGWRYAWAVVVLAAGLSGLAQASYLAGGVGSAPAGLRFGVGAWPAVAAAIAAHLLHLIGGPNDPVSRLSGARHGVPPWVSHRSTGAVPAVPCTGSGQPSDDLPGLAAGIEVGRLSSPGQPVSQAERAQLIAEAHAARTGELPSVRELADLAEVGRGTADRALAALRAAHNGSGATPDGAFQGPQQ